MDRSGKEVGEGVSSPIGVGLFVINRFEMKSFIRAVGVLQRREQ